MTGAQLFSEWVKAGLCFETGLRYTWDALYDWERERWNQFAAAVALRYAQ